MDKTLEQLVDEESMQNNGEKLLYAEDVINLLKQVRVATIKECINKIQVEHKSYHVNGTYKSELLGEETLYDLSEPWNYFSTNKEELNNLDLNSIEL